MGDGAECPGWIPGGAKLNKTPTKFPILEFSHDEKRKSPCLKIAVPKAVAGAFGVRYGDSIIIAPEYKPAGAGCRSLYAPSALRVVVSCQSSVVSGSWQSEEHNHRERGEKRTAKREERTPKDAKSVKKDERPPFIVEPRAARGKAPPLDDMSGP